MQKRGNVAGLPKVEPWHPAHYEIPDAAAVQAVAQGRASEDQQRRAMKYLVERLCATYDLSYRPASSRDTDFAEGKRFVGLQLVKLINLNIAKLRGKVTEQGEAPKPTEQG